MRRGSGIGRASRARKNRSDPRGTASPEAETGSPRLGSLRSGAAEIRRFYGNAPADRLTALLHEHARLAQEIALATVRGDQAAAGRAQASWFENAAALAAFFAMLDPTSQQPSPFASLFEAHLDLGLEQLRARSRMDFEADVLASDAQVANALELADVLARRLGAQAPSPIPTVL